MSGQAIRWAKRVMAIPHWHVMVVSHYVHLPHDRDNSQAQKVFPIIVTGFSSNCVCANIRFPGCSSSAYFTVKVFVDKQILRVRDFDQFICVVEKNSMYKCEGSWQYFIA